MFFLMKFVVLNPYFKCAVLPKVAFINKNTKNLIFCTFYSFPLVINYVCSETITKLKQTSFHDIPPTLRSKHTLSPTTVKINKLSSPFPNSCFSGQNCTIVEKILHINYLSNYPFIYSYNRYKVDNTQVVNIICECLIRNVSL